MRRKIVFFFQICSYTLHMIEKIDSYCNNLPQQIYFSENPIYLSCKLAGQYGFKKQISIIQSSHNFEKRNVDLVRLYQFFLVGESKNRRKEERKKIRKNSMNSKSGVIERTRSSPSSFLHYGRNCQILSKKFHVSFCSSRLLQSPDKCIVIFFHYLVSNLQVYSEFQSNTITLLGSGAEWPKDQV